jgi:pyridinium-3,5-bisthiocarboxylic acid mononucleotide nickel chelatase
VKPAPVQGPPPEEGPPVGSSTLWIDAGNGAAGDMLLAALLDAGADLVAVRAGLAKLAVEPLGVDVAEVHRGGLRAAQVTVRAPDSTVERRLSDVVTVIDAAGLPAPVAGFAGAVFDTLARAEARVHGVSVDEVHFHEVGALDAIADVIGCALALHDLGLLDSPVRVVSPVAVGSGWVRSAHGRLPVPVPAVLEVLHGAGAPVAAHPVARELCTPTGAALLATLATGWGPPPTGVVRAVGVGAGRADIPGHPNAVRVVVGIPAPDGVAPLDGPTPLDGAAGGWQEETLWQVETTVDDMDPRLWPDLLARLRDAGAADAWCAPVLMRKGRPGQVLTVLVRPELLDPVCRLVFVHTPTLGLRMREVRRRVLPRDLVTVQVAGGEVRVKRGFLQGRAVTVQPEYDDACEVAGAGGLPVAEVIDTARAAARSAGGSPVPAPVERTQGSSTVCPS